MLINRALIRYGYPNFRLEILEYCKPEDLVARENYHISFLNPEYNIVKKSHTMPSRLGHTHAKSTLEKMSNSNPNRITISVTDILTNSEKTYRSMSQAAKDLNIARTQIRSYLLKKQVKPIHKRYIITKLEISYEKTVKVVESWRRGIPIEVLDLDTKTKTVYSSMRSAAFAIGIEHSTIRKYLGLGEPYKNKYKFSYYIEPKNIY